MREKQSIIEVWHPADIPQIELRRGIHVADPVPRHWHDEYQFCLVQQGSGGLYYRGAKYDTPASSLFIVYPGEVHSNRAYEETGCNYRTIYLHPEYMRAAAAEFYARNVDPPFFPTTVIFDPNVITEYLCVNDAIEQQSLTLEKQNLLMNFLYVFIERFAERSYFKKSSKTPHDAVRIACEYLSDNLVENVSMEDLTRVTNVSPFHLSRVFSEQIGVPPHMYQTQLRVLKAKRLLRQRIEIAEVALQLGFADQSHFTRHFKRLTGTTPGKYIQNSKNVQ